MRSHKKPALAALIALALVAAGCGDDGDTAPGENSTTTVTTTAAPEPTPVPTAAPEAQPTSTTEPAPEPVERDFTAISPIVQAFVDEHELNGAGLIVVDREDGVVHEEYWGEFSADRISLVASSSKMITAGVLLRLDDDGLLDIDAPVVDAVAWGSGNPEITPAQLVSNSSGLVGLGPDLGYASYLCQFSPNGTLQDCGEAIFTTDADDADVIAPDTTFRYGGGQWQVAGAVAEAVSGTSWADLINEIYVEPCGLETLAYNNHFTQLGVPGLSSPRDFDSDPSTLAASDNPSMEGGAYVTTGDYARLLLMHLRDGMCGDTQVLSTDALDRLHTDRVAEVYEGDAASANPGYGMGWWVDRGSGLITDGGAYGSVPWLDLDDGFGAYLVIEENSALGQQLAAALYDPVEAAVLG